MDQIGIFINDLWNILDQIQNDDPQLSVLQKLNIKIGEFTDFISVISSKQPKSYKTFMNTHPNPIAISQLVRQLLSIDYQSTSILIANLIQKFSFKDSMFLTQLKMNGGQYLLSRHIIKYKQNQSIYISCLEQLSTGDISSLLLKAIFYHFSQFKCNLVAVFVNNKVNPIFVQIFISIALQSDNFTDIVYIIHAISWLIQSPLYVDYVSLGKVVQNLAQLIKQDNSLKTENKNITIANISLEGLKFELVTQQKRVKIAKINITNKKDEIKELQQDIIKQQPNLVSQREVLQILKEKFIELQKTMNKQEHNQAKKSPQQLIQIENYEKHQQQLRTSETKVNDLNVQISNLEKRQSQKEKELTVLFQIEKQCQQEVQSIENKINQFLGLSPQLVSSQELKKEQKIDISLTLDNTPILQFSQAFLSFLIKLPEGLQFFTQRVELGQNFCIMLSSLNKSTQLIACINFISDALLLENNSRKNIYSLLNCGNLIEVDHIRLDNYGNSIFYPLISGLLDQQFNSSQTQTLTYIYMYLDGLERIQYQKLIPTSFIGNKYGQNLSISYMTNLIYRLLEIGFFEAVIYQICKRSSIQVISAFLYILSEFLNICKTHVPIVYDYYRHKIFIPVNSYSNQYSQNSLLISKTKTLVAEVNESTCHDYLIEEEKYSRFITQKSELQNNLLFSTDPQLTELNIWDYQDEPIKWNWEQINIIINHHMSSVFIQSNTKLLEFLIQFIDGTIELQIDNIKSNKNYLFAFLPPLPDLKENYDYQAFNDLLKNSIKYTSLLSLPICNQTARIGQICLNFLSKLIQYQSGIIMIKSSKIFHLIVEHLTFTLNEQQYNRQHIAIISSILGVLSLSYECCQVMDDFQIIDILYELQIKQIHPSLISFLIISLSPSCQSAKEQKSTTCICGKNCLRKYSENDKVKVAIQGFLQSHDVRIRYQSVNRLAQQFRKRQYFLNLSKPICSCLCFNCSNIQHQSMLISKEDEKWALYCLVPMINDIQPEIAVACLCIIEELVSIEDVDIFVDNQINLDNWKNLGQYLRVKIMQSEKGCKFLGVNTILSSLNQQWIYRWVHNLEYKQFLSLTRQLSSSIKDSNYDKIIRNSDYSSDIYYTTQDQFAYDFLCLPHNNSCGRVVLQLPESLDDIPEIVRKDFWQNRTVQIQNQSFSSCQSYARGSVLVSLSLHEFGRNLILQSGLVAEIQQKLYSEDYERYSFRGNLWAFALICGIEEGRLLFNDFDQIFSKILQLSVYCKFEKTRFTAQQALQVLITNKYAQNLMHEKNFTFNLIKLRDEVFSCVNLPSETINTVYNGIKRVQTNLFKLNNQEINIQSNINFVASNNQYYSQPIPVYYKFKEESGTVFQNQIETNLLGISLVPNFTELLLQNQRIDKRNKFSEEIEKFRLQFQLQQSIQPQIDDQLKQCLKLILVDNIIDAEAGIQQLRYQYQKDFRAEIYFYQILQDQDCKFSIIKEVNDIFGNISPQIIDYLVEVENSWK
ncbi:hypothetical protein SS50377_22280 [Spironucleus salmonicida]|uniref:Rapamycin-insensitive companion of mTOR domain-containing protein n=1 Tax=Spironucleus salmonicida TaxID=348837 RepID=V6LEX4_9EUKA|nr:hypothetical protein SS50377_22280 [Spironucleus salmonicida]|eukprot:EST42226.1 hypothetical protein SS50377_18528 [Spironucleus salmonicida]